MTLVQVGSYCLLLFASLEITRIIYEMNLTKFAFIKIYFMAVVAGSDGTSGRSRKMDDFKIILL